jgi:hypothetical protein
MKGAKEKLMNIEGRRELGGLSAASDTCRLEASLAREEWMATPLMVKMET